MALSFTFVLRTGLLIARIVVKAQNPGSNNSCKDVLCLIDEVCHLGCARDSQLHLSIAYLEQVVSVHLGQQCHELVSYQLSCVYEGA